MRAPIACWIPSSSLVAMWMSLLIAGRSPVAHLIALLHSRRPTRGLGFYDASVKGGYMDDWTLLKVFITLPPRVNTTAMMSPAMAATISPYSTAVAPCSSRTKSDSLAIFLLPRCCPLTAPHISAGAARLASDKHQAVARHERPERGGVRAQAERRIRYERSVGGPAKKAFTLATTSLAVPL